MDILKNQKDFFGDGKSLKIEYRINALKKLREIIRKKESDISNALQADLGKARFESYVAEIGIILDEINYHIKNLRKWSKPSRVSTPLFLQPAKSRIYPEPRGCVLIMAPWNYPFQLIFTPLIGAVSSGCCSIVKPSEISTASEKVIQDIIADSFEEGHVACVTGGPETAQKLLALNFDYIFFTGGTALGKIVAEAAAKNLTPFTLELGGKSPCIVTRDACIPTAAKRIAWGKFLNAGQTCIAPDYILAEKNIMEELSNHIEKYTFEFFGEDIEKSPDYGRIINQKHFERISAYLKDGDIRFGGKTNPDTRYIAPTILMNPKENSPVMSDEIFGPVLPIHGIDSAREAVDFINKRPKPLSLYLFTNDKKIKDEIISRIPFGGGCVNDVMTHIANNRLPFGGIGPSEMGSYHGKKSFEIFTHYKSIIVNSFWPDIPFRYQPYSECKLKMIKKIMG